MSRFHYNNILTIDKTNNSPEEKEYNNSRRNREDEGKYIEDPGDYNYYRIGHLSIQEHTDDNLISSHRSF